MARVAASGRVEPSRYSVLFNGTSDVLTMTNQNLTNITVFIRFKLASGETSGDFINKYSGGSSRSWVLGCGSTTSIRFYMSLDGSATSAEILATVSSFANSTGWHSAAGTYNGTTARLYFDGVQVGTPVNVSGSIFTSATAPKAGSFNNTRYGSYNGNLDDIMLFNQALSADDIAALHAGLGSTVSPTVIHTLNEGSGIAVNDQSGNGRRATLTGGTWQTDFSGFSLWRLPTVNRVVAANRITP